MSRTAAQALAAAPPAATALQLVDIELADLAGHPRNVRRDVGDVTELAESIAELGILEPLLVAPNPAAGDAPAYVVIAGHRRLAAAQVAALATVPCIIRADLTTDVQVTLAMLTENLQRTDLTPIEEATAYAQLELAGMTTKDIARRTGRARSTVESRLRLLDLPDDVKDRVHAHQVTLDEAATLGEFAGDAAAMKRLDKALGTSNWAYMVEMERRAARERAAIADTAARLAARGIRIADLGYQTWEIGGSKHPEADRLYRLGFEPTWAHDAADKSDDPSSWHRDAAWPDHEGCPGHAAVIESSTQVMWLCTSNAVEHRAAAEPDNDGRVVQTNTAYRPPTATETPEQAEARAQRERELAAAKARRDALLTAQTVRQDWLRPLLTGSKPLPKGHPELIVRHLTAELVSDAEVLVGAGEVLVLLGVDIDDVDEDTFPERAALELAVRDPHRALLASLAACHEDELDREHGWTSAWNRPHTVAWMRLLVALGYTPSDLEAELVAEPEPEAEPEPDDSDIDDEQGTRPIEDVPTGDLL